MPVPLLEAYAGRGIRIRQGFGMTETGPTVFLVDEAHNLVDRSMPALGALEPRGGAEVAGVPAAAARVHRDHPGAVVRNGGILPYVLRRLAA